MVKKLTIPKSRIGKREVGGQYYPPTFLQQPLAWDIPMLEVAKELSIGKTAETIGPKFAFQILVDMSIAVNLRSIKKEKILSFFFIRLE